MRKMSRKTEVLCDRCGREITSYDIKISSARIDLWGIGVPRSYPGQRIDLCEGCFEALLTFMENGKGSEDEE